MLNLFRSLTLMASAKLLVFSSHSPNLPQNPNPSIPSISSRRQYFLNAAVLSITLQSTLPFSLSAETLSAPSKSILSGLANTKSWFQFFGSGFAIRVPPEFQDMTEPEDYNAGLSLYGDKAKTKTYAARFESSDRSEVVSVVIKPSNQLKITFLEAKDISDIGSLKEAAKLFVPGGSTLYSARTIKIKEDEGFRTYYFYEFGKYDQHFALAATVNSGKVIIGGASAPESRWIDDGIKLRSAAVSLTIL